MEKDSNDRSTLISLCCEAKIPELQEKLALPQFKQLLCAPLKFRDFQNETILHYMCAYTFEEPEVVEVLLEHGADACINNGPITPLSYAAKRNYKDLVRLLLKHGAYPEPAMAYATNPEILQLLKKKVHDMRRGGSNDTSNKSPKSPKSPKSHNISPNQDSPKQLVSQPKQEQNKVSLAVSKHITSLISYLEESTTQTVSDRLAKAGSFSEIAAAFKMICEQYKPEGEKATGEFVVSLLLLPWGLPTFARHVAIDHHGQANRIAEAVFSSLPAYKVAVYVESRLANFEKDRPRSSFPHLYVTLVHAVADTIISSLIGATQSPPSSSEDMAGPTMKLLKWVSAVGFVSVSSHAEPTSILKNRILAKTLFLTFRHISFQPRSQDGSPSPAPTPESSSPLYPSNDFSPQIFSPLTISETPTDSSSSSPTLPSDVIVPLLPNVPSSSSQPSQATDPQSTTTHQSTIPPEQQSTPNEQPIAIHKPSPVRRSITPPPHSTASPQVSLPPRPITPPPRPASYKPYTISESWPMPELLSPLGATKITTQPTAYLITIKLEHHPTGGINIKMYNTTALAVLHDKISGRLRGRIANPLVGNEHGGRSSPKGFMKDTGNFVFMCQDGRRISMNEPGIIGDLAHPDNTVILHVLRG